MARGLRDDDRIARRRAQPRVQTDGPAVIDQPTGSGFDIGPMMALGGNTREAEKVAEFADKAEFVFLEVGQDILHGCRD